MKGVRVLGIDPGSRLAGYGCVDLFGRDLKLVEHGTLSLIELGKSKSSQDENSVTHLAYRLLRLRKMLTEVVQKLQPDVMAIERVFFAKNAASALSLGHARGVVLAVAAEFSVEIAEYAPAEIKKSVTGSGRADKEQVAQMMKVFFGAQNFKTSDASDALALACAHALCRNSVVSRGASRGKRLADILGLS